MWHVQRFRLQRGFCMWFCLLYWITPIILTVSRAGIHRWVCFCPHTPLYTLSLSLSHTHTHTRSDGVLFVQDDRLIADPVNHKLIAPVISVSSDRLVTSHCVNLNHEIICDSDGVNTLNLSQHLYFNYESLALQFTRTLNTNLVMKQSWTL